MRILLVGEYSNVHWTLAEGLRALGHSVTVVSDGDDWKDYPRDIDLTRRYVDSPSRLRRWWGALCYMFRLARIWPTLRGYDVVQLINPVFLSLKAERHWPFYRYLRRHNRCVVMGAFGIDYYWVKVGMDGTTFRYSDFHLFGEQRDYPFLHTMIHDWLEGAKGTLNRRIAEDCDVIVSGLYEYEMCYRPFFRNKLQFIPFPINLEQLTSVLPTTSTPPPLRCFIGIQRQRSSYKGTDIMLAALRRLQNDYPSEIEVVQVENVPYARYQQLMDSSHVLLDQLYSYTPGMNGLLAMAKGLILVGGGEPEQYDLLGEDHLRPIVNVQPTEQDVYDQILHQLIEHPESIRQRQADSIEYIRRHHDYIKIAHQYENLYQRALEKL